MDERNTLLRNHQKKKKNSKLKTAIIYMESNQILTINYEQHPNRSTDSIFMENAQPEDDKIYERPSAKKVCKKSLKG
jgi:hypothetical protein